MKEIYETTIKVKSDTRDIVHQDRKHFGMRSIDDYILVLRSFLMDSKIPYGQIKLELLQCQKENQALKRDCKRLINKQDKINILHDNKIKRLINKHQKEVAKLKERLKRRKK